MSSDQPPSAQMYHFKSECLNLVRDGLWTGQKLISTAWGKNKHWYSLDTVGAEKEFNILEQRVGRSHGGQPGDTSWWQEQFDNINQFPGGVMGSPSLEVFKQRPSVGGGPALDFPQFSFQLYDGNIFYFRDTSTSCLLLNHSWRGVQRSTGFCTSVDPVTSFSRCA